MKVDFKVTTWERVEVPEEHKESVLEAIKSGEISTAQDIFNFLVDDDGGLSCHKLDETDEQMTVDENGGNSTIEVLDGEEYVFHNGKL